MEMRLVDFVEAIRERIEKGGFSVEGVISEVKEKEDEWKKDRRAKFRCTVWFDLPTEADESPEVDEASDLG